MDCVSGLVGEPGGALRLSALFSLRLSQIILVNNLAKGPLHQSWVPLPEDSFPDLVMPRQP